MFLNFIINILYVDLFSHGVIDAGSVIIGQKCSLSVTIYICIRHYMGTDYRCGIQAMYDNVKGKSSQKSMCYYFMTSSPWLYEYFLMPP